MTAYRLPCSVETVHEMDSDGPGSVIGFHLGGHVDFQTVEEFMACDGIFDEYGMDLDVVRHWDISHTYVGTTNISEDGEEMEDAWLFIYSREPREGYKPITLIQEARIASHFCAYHPFEPAYTGVSVLDLHTNSWWSVLETEKWSDEYMRRASIEETEKLWLCSDCREAFAQRRQEAARQARVEIDFEKKQKELVPA